MLLFIHRRPNYEKLERYHTRFSPYGDQTQAFQPNFDSLTLHGFKSADIPRTWLWREGDEGLPVRSEGCIGLGQGLLVLDGDRVVLYGDRVVCSRSRSEN